MISCLQTHVRRQLIIALFFEFENELKLCNLQARPLHSYFSAFREEWLSGRELAKRLKGRWFETHGSLFGVSLGKILYPLFSYGSTQEDR